VINDAYRHCGLYAGSGWRTVRDRGRIRHGAAAVSLILESRESMKDAAGGRTGECSKAHQRATRRRSRGGVPRGLAATWLAQACDQLGQRNVDRSGGARGAATGCAGAIVSSVYGHLAESFSVGPLCRWRDAFVGPNDWPARRGAGQRSGIVAARGTERRNRSSPYAPTTRAW